MQKLSAVKTLKPVGGVARVRLVPVGGEGIEMPLVEERSSYDEEILCDDGLLRVCHRQIGRASCRERVLIQV